jgi:hypothetical protein
MEATPPPVHHFTPVDIPQSAEPKKLHILPCTKLVCRLQLASWMEREAIYIHLYQGLAAQHNHVDCLNPDLFPEFPLSMARRLMSLNLQWKFIIDNFRPVYKQVLIFTWKKVLVNGLSPTSNFRLHVARHAAGQVSSARRYSVVREDMSHVSQYRAGRSSCQRKFTGGRVLRQIQSSQAGQSIVTETKD